MTSIACSKCVLMPTTDTIQMFPTLEWPSDHGLVAATLTFQCELPSAEDNFATKFARVCS